MRFLNWLYETLRSRSQLSSEIKELDDLERAHKGSSKDIWDVRSRYQFDLLNGDETNQKMTLE